MSEENEKETLKIKAGKRTYFFDLKTTKDEKYYLEITESKNIGNSFERYSIMIFQEEFDKFKEALNTILDFKEKETINNKENKTFNLEEIRKKIPNAYRKWEVNEDEELLRLDSEGMTIKELSLYFNRTKGSIESRLKRLFEN